MRAMVIAILLCCLQATEGVGKSAMLSAAGRKRLSENVEILKANAADLKEAIETTDKNIEVVKKELTDLDSLEKEHVALQGRYQAYLDSGTREARKNQKAIEDLEKWEKEHRSLASQGAGDSGGSSRVESAQKELSERRQWKADADAKLQKVSELAIGLEKNLRDIRSRREPLRAQQRSLERRRLEFVRARDEVQRKAVELESQLRRQAPVPAAEDR